MKKKIIVISCIILIPIIVFNLPIKIIYTVYGTGKIFTSNEWILGKTLEGRITSTLKNNEFGYVNSFGDKEFQRSDVFDFELDKNIYSKKYIAKGEVVGTINSNELRLNLLQLEGNLKVEEAYLEVLSSGQKFETVEEAKKNLELAKEKYNIQTKLIARTKKLFKDSLIPAQQYDVALNNFETARIAVAVAEAQIKVLTSGDKPQLIFLSQQKISSLQNQILNLKKRLEAFTLRSPISGMLQNKKGGLPVTTEVIVNVLDTSSFIVVTPVQTKELTYLSLNQKVDFIMFNSDTKFKGTITNIDNAVQLVGGKQAVYITTLIQGKVNNLMPGIFVESVIGCDNISLWDYFKRMFGGVFYK